MAGPVEFLGTDLSTWEIGPYHGALPAPMRLILRLDGEMIVTADVDSGYLHRGLEKTFELHSWKSAVAYADHLDPEAGAFAELALCLAVEDIADIEIPARARAIRIILCELTRISSHLLYVVRVAKSVGAETIIHYVLRDRERILDLFELLAGSRFAINFLRFGGVAADVTEGFIERVLEACDMVRVRLKEYNDIFTYNHAFLTRTRLSGVIAPETALAYGMTGPNARASGHSMDVRKRFPYSGYDRVDFAVPQGEGSGCVHDRFLTRLREIEQSMEILKHVAEAIPPGEFLNTKIERLPGPPPGEAYARVESGRGLLGCHVVSDGKANPCRVQFRTPSLATMAALPELLAGVRIEDLPVMLASLDLGVAEADR